LPDPLDIHCAWPLIKPSSVPLKCDQNERHTTDKST